MTHRVLRMAAFAGIAILLATQVQAQQPDRRPGGAGFGGSPLLTLIANETVQKELELVDDQSTKLKTVRDAIAAKIREGATAAGGQRPNFQNLSEEERAKLRADGEKRATELAKEVKTKLGEVLLPHQMERLEEIALQARGTRALQDAEVAAKLKLTDDQKAQLTKLEEEGRQGGRPAGGNAGGGFDIEAFRKARQERSDKLLAVLTADQKAAFEKMQGEKFPNADQLLFGGGQQRRPAGNNNNNN